MLFRSRQGEVVEAAVPIFHIETTLNNDMYDGPLAFLAKPEARWTAREQTTFAALKRTTDRMNPKLRRAACKPSRGRIPVRVSKAGIEPALSIGAKYPKSSPPASV